MENNTNKEKKKYSRPEIEIIYFAGDVITTSDNKDQDNEKLPQRSEGELDLF